MAKLTPKTHKYTKKRRKESNASIYDQIRGGLARVTTELCMMTATLKGHLAVHRQQIKAEQVQLSLSILETEEWMCVSSRKRSV